MQIRIQERRDFVRHDVNIKGVLFVGDSHFEGTIRDASEDGARFRVEKRVAGKVLDDSKLMAKAYLIDKETTRTFECQIRRVGGGVDLGLFFVDAGTRNVRRQLIDRHNGSVEGARRIVA